MIEIGAALAIHPGALGDVLLAIPALRALRAQRPGRTLALAGQPRLARLLTALGEVDRALDFESLALDALFTTDPARARPLLEPVEQVVCWFGSRDPLFVANLRSIVPGALVAPPAAADVPVWQHLRRTVGAPLDGEAAPLRVPPVVAETGRQALLNGGWDGARPVVVMHPGAGSTAKRWPADAFATVARDVSRGRALALVVHEGPADAEAAAALLAALGPTVIHLQGLTLEALSGALAYAALYLGNDSGVSHLAAAVGAPSVVLFTRGLLGWRPWGATVDLPVVSTGKIVPADLERVLAAARAAMT
jgi:lipopolysaccharide heptosyltransferase III